MANISKQRREELISKINKIKESIFSLEDDVNKQTLIQYLSDLENEIKGKKYGLVYEEHKESIDEKLENNTPILVENESLFINNGDKINFVIEGDNLASLKLLEKTHSGKIDIIYIDPPYNTGHKDFIYEDDYVDANDTFKHSKWISFIKIRLELAKKLLKTDGAIFISIDNNEAFVLKNLCDEIFGESNFIDAIIWNKKSSAKGVPPKSMMVNVHEYILVYSNGGNYKFSGEKRDLTGFKNPDNDPRGPWRESNIKSTTKSMDEAFTITDPNTGRQYTNTWAFSKESLEKMIIENRILWKQSLPKQKEFFYEMTNENKAIKSSWGVFDPQSTTVYLKELLPSVKFDNPKPISLMSYLVEVSTKKNDLILDFFAGSGTTAHAVLRVNKNDGGNRKFILCNTEKNGICRDVTYERIKRVIEKENYQASLKYMKVDFVPISEQFYYEYADQLLLHVRELVELENGINFKGNSEIAIILTDEELEEFTNNINENCKTIYLGHDVLPTGEQLDVINSRKIKINIIPDYYYGELGA